MKKLLILMALLLTGCGAMQVSAQEIDTEYRTPQPTATASIVPTATVEYQATAHAAETQAYIAQSTADAANRIMVQATNDQQQREHEAAMQNADATAQAEANHMIELGWTATAYQTSMPLTATAQVDNMTAIADYKAVTIAQLTATAAYPTQIVAESNARTQAKYAPVYVFVQVFAIFAIGVFLFFTAYMMRWYWMREDARATQAAHAASPQGVAEKHGFTPIEEVEPEPSIIHSTELVQQMPRVERPVTAENLKYTIPSAQEQFDIFAEKLVTGEMALSINKWETSGLLSGVKNARTWIKNMRGWMHANEFGVFNENDEMTLVQAGRAWLEQYIEHRSLPTEYQFGEAAQ